MKSELGPEWVESGQRTTFRYVWNWHWLDGTFPSAMDRHELTILELDSQKIAA
jgi:hypothetical protein